MDKPVKAIVYDNTEDFRLALGDDPRLVTQLFREASLFNGPISHWIYVGDTLLHLAAAGYRVEIGRLLLKSGADPNASKNMRKSSPLHYAADGYITGPS